MGLVWFNSVMEDCQLESFWPLVPVSPYSDGKPPWNVLLLALASGRSCTEGRAEVGFICLAQLSLPGPLGPHSLLPPGVIAWRHDMVAPARRKAAEFGTPGCSMGACQGLIQPQPECSRFRPWPWHRDGTASRSSRLWRSGHAPGPSRPGNSDQQGRRLLWSMTSGAGRTLRDF